MQFKYVLCSRQHEPESCQVNMVHREMQSANYCYYDLVIVHIQLYKVSVARSRCYLRIKDVIVTQTLSHSSGLSGGDLMSLQNHKTGEFSVGSKCHPLSAISGFGFKLLNDTDCSKITTNKRWVHLMWEWTPRHCLQHCPGLIVTITSVVI